MSGILGGLIGSYTGVTSSFESIATANGTGSAGAITFSSIPSTYKSLQIRITARDTALSGTTNVSMFANNVNTGTPYAYHWVTASGSGSATATGVEGASSIVIGGIPNAANTSTTTGCTIIDIVDYTSTSKNKTFRIYSTFNLGSNSGQVRLGSGLWDSTAAINRLDFQTNGTAFTTTSTVSLYGIKG
jgi:hypothetical protein